MLDDYYSSPLLLLPHATLNFSNLKSTFFLTTTQEHDDYVYTIVIGKVYFFIRSHIHIHRPTAAC